MCVTETDNTEGTAFQPSEAPWLLAFPSSIFVEVSEQPLEGPGTYIYLRLTIEPHVSLLPMAYPRMHGRLHYPRSCLIQLYQFTPPPRHMPSAKKTHMVIDSTGQQSFLKRTGRQLAVGYLQSPVPKVDVETYEHYYTLLQFV